MKGSKEIAEDMVSVLQGNDDSDMMIATKGLAQGLIDFPIDVGYLTYDFLDTEHRWENGTDKLRFSMMIKSGMVSKESIEKILKIVLEEYFNKLDPEQVKKIVESKAAKLIGGVITKNIILRDVIAALVTRWVTRITAGFVITTILSVGAIYSRAIYTSRELKNECYGLYKKLIDAGDLDLLYFLIENKTKHFEEMLAIYNNDKALFDDVANSLIVELNKDVH